MDAKREGRAAWRLVMFAAAVAFVAVVGVTVWAWFVEGVGVGVFVQRTMERIGL